jgi:hypothetical protein
MESVSTLLMDIHFPDIERKIISENMLTGDFRWFTEVESKRINNNDQILRYY